MRGYTASGTIWDVSVSTGFRAPTPGQQNAFNVSTQWDPNLLELVNNGTIPSTSRVAALRGGKALDAEKSFNLAAGMVLERGSFLLTADVFRIDLRDRLGVTQLFALERDEVDQLLAEGITSAANPRPVRHQRRLLLRPVAVPLGRGELSQEPAA